jgi:hypothetical protein
MEGWMEGWRDEGWREGGMEATVAGTTEGFFSRKLKHTVNKVSSLWDFCRTWKEQDKSGVYS